MNTANKRNESLGCVDFDVDARLERVAHWASTAFATPSLTAALAAGAGRGAPCALVSLRDGHRLWLHVRRAAQGGGRGATPSALRITLRCAEIALAARIVQGPSFLLFARYSFVCS